MGMPPTGRVKSADTAWTTQISTMDSRCSRPSAPKGHFPKDRFDIDLDKQTVTCPAGHTTAIRAAPPRRRRHAGHAEFGPACDRLPAGRPVHHRRRTAAPSPSATTKQPWPPAAPASTTPSGKPTTGPPAPKSNARSATSCAAATADAAPASADWPKSPPTSHLLAAAVNLARLAVLGITRTTSGWTTATA